MTFKVGDRVQATNGWEPETYGKVGTISSDPQPSPVLGASFSVDFDGGPKGWTMFEDELIEAPVEPSE